ncbi:class I SAM-dependent methyltransferase [Dactylosporangium matsuzakiense]|uniref:Tetracenomycin C synthesis protein n=3 Tax=Dactylosporangium matsuzakiense TaxID=53360 RepID=A0A9W6KT03_9ACTN|nr:tetracenomycin C synthesis protein [Dactylosporangium matsuzakiense]
MLLAMVQLGAIQETMLLTLHARAANGDGAAQRLVSAIDYDFTVFERHKGLTALFHVLRCGWYDEWTRQFLAECPGGTVVELGAGLTTRADRLDNGAATWVFADLPDATALRRTLLPDTARRRTVTASVLDPAWPSAVAAEGPCLFLAEGLLVYLEPAAVRTVLATVAARFPGSRIALDTYGSWIVARPRGPLRHMAADLVWACDDPQEVQRWGIGLTLRESHRLTRPVRRTLPRRTRLALHAVNALAPAKMIDLRVSLYSA